MDIPLPDGSTRRVRAWVDNGNPDLQLSRRVASLMGLAVTCGDKSCSAPPPHEITIGGVKISLAAVKEAKIHSNLSTPRPRWRPGMSAEINIPSTILRNYDVLINYPGSRIHHCPTRQPEIQRREGKSKRELREWPHPDSQPD